MCNVFIIEIITAGQITVFLRWTRTFTPQAFTVVILWFLIVNAVLSEFNRLQSGVTH